MFNEEFFPTPPEVIKRMVTPYITGRRGYDETMDLTILEPSAGKGDILDFIQTHYRHREGDLYCMEINQDLQFILREKGYRVIGADFLNYTGDYFFDLIVMNPPFSNGDEHLLKAWEILEEGQICCLLNSETINNPFTEKRKLLAKIIADNGTVEHIGKAFSKAENKTLVDVSIVRLSKKCDRKKYDFSFAQVTNEKGMNITEDLIKNQLATRDVVGNMMLQFEKVKEYYVNYLKAIEGLKFYSDPLIPEHGPTVMSIAEKCTGSTAQAKYNRFNTHMKEQIWQVVMNKLNIEKWMTHNLRTNFHKFTKSQGALDFTKENVAALIEFIFLNKDQILEDSIIEVFDIFTRYHKENRLHVEGWKTNDKFKVNRKIILPHWVKWGEYCTVDHLRQYGDSFKTNYSYHSEYSDIDKVMCYLTGENHDHIYSIYESLKDRFHQLGNVNSGSFDGTCESTFFKMRFYKKGTLHIEFKDKYLWEEFNMRACAGKKWLPEYEERKWRQAKEKENRPAAAAKPEPVKELTNQLILY